MAAGRAYPWAAAGLNVAQALLGLLALRESSIRLPPSEPAWDSPLLLFFCASGSPDPFFEVFALAMELLDAQFLAAGAGYMARSRPARALAR